MTFLSAAEKHPSFFLFPCIARAIIRYAEIGRNGNCRYCFVLYFHLCALACESMRITLSKTLRCNYATISCIKCNLLGPDLLSRLIIDSFICMNKNRAISVNPTFARNNLYYGDKFVIIMFDNGEV